MSSLKSFFLFPKNTDNTIEPIPVTIAEIINPANIAVFFELVFMKKKKDNINPIPPKTNSTIETISNIFNFDKIFFLFLITESKLFETISLNDCKFSFTKSK